MRKVIFLMASAISLSAVAADFACPSPSDITMASMPNGQWLYQATEKNGVIFVQNAGFEISNNNNIANLTYVMLFPVSAAYPGDMECNYATRDGGGVTLWSYSLVNPGSQASGNQWRNPSYKIYYCYSQDPMQCPVSLK